jgi:hypothetical protein
MDLAGIENEAEFFPAGTLSDVLEAELQDITSRWSRELEGKNPVDRLASISDRLITALAQLRNASDRITRQELHNQCLALVTEALGYTQKRELCHLALDSGGAIPVINKTFDADGKCQLWIIETPVVSHGEEDSDPLGLSFSQEQFGETPDAGETELAIEELVAEGIFSLTDAPRYLLIASPTQWVLLDSRKWPARSVLRFNLQEIYSRQDKDTYRVMACLVAREARVPHIGAPLSDRLEEEAQRNANAVTTSLKRTVRDAIEILGQEVLDVTEGKFPRGEKRGVWIDGETLSLECLRYMYRLLFLLYAESNPRLRILDLKDPVYASGYSMEALRDLESVRLRTPAEKNGTYLWESLQQILGFLFSGEQNVLKVPAVKVSLLDPESTPLLNSVKLRNEAVQKVIRLLSLRQSKKSTGRISYAKLGIGQLGAVYETLISFTGTVAKEDLIELKGDSKDRAAVVNDQEGSDNDSESDAVSPEFDEFDAEEELESRVDKIDLLAPTYFVPRRRIDEFNPDAVVFQGTQAKIYPKGSFTYRLAGRDREKTAAYYTPEPLARLLVKHLLMERCKDLSADELLDLKILEPAMGSAAFLVETTNQLADLYLERKQKEVGKTIPQEEIIIEKQRVRSFIADRNCFGVDLNPTAVELGAISLWLNGLHKGEFSPWFGDQLHAGNSLIGARRAVYPSSQLKGKAADLWFKNAPKELGWKEPRSGGEVYQWLLPAEDMAAFEKDKSIKEFAGEHQARIKAWRAGGFFKPLQPHEINLVQRLTKVADELFNIVAEELAQTRNLANDEITLWPETTKAGSKGVGYQKKEILKQRLLGEDHATNTLPFKRLKTAMDAWCSLWLWPIEKADKLPSRQEFLEGMRILLEGGFSADGSLSTGAEDDFAVPMQDLFDQPVVKPETKFNMGLFQETNVESFIELHDWLQVSTEVAKKARFVHYDLIFADILKERGGFDLIVGNPPWAKPNWNEGQVLADLDPLYAGLSASDAKKVMSDALAKSKATKDFLEEYSLTKGSMEVTSSGVMNPFIGGGSNNLYRCFMDLSFRLTAPEGYAALIHQDGHLGDPKAGSLRRHWYGRIAKHFEFSNKIKSKMFAEVHDEVLFSLNVYRGQPTEVSFDQFTNAFLPSQIDDSYADTEGLGEIPGKKNSEGDWDTRGHKDRVIRIDLKALATIHSISEEESCPIEESSFIQPFSKNTLNVFEQLSKAKVIGRDIEFWQQSLVMLEADSQKKGWIKKEKTVSKSNSLVILQGPLFHVGNPIYKTSKQKGFGNNDYIPVDLSSIPANFRSRTNFLPISYDLEKLLPKCRWDPTKSHIDDYRIAYRAMVALNGERSLIAAMIPPKYAHVNAVESFLTKNVDELLDVYCSAISLVFDAYIKASGRTHYTVSDANSMLYVKANLSMKVRALALCCLTEEYSHLWKNFSLSGKMLRWADNKNGLLLDISLDDKWTWNQGIRTDLARRQALLEIDVLTAQQLKLTLEQLVDLYRIYFPVLKDNEDGTWFDKNGRIVWTSSRGLPGVGYLNQKGKSPGRKEWEAILETNPPELVCTAIDDTRPGGPYTVERRFVGPFFKCDRIEDYKRAWAHFDKLEQEGKL